MTVRPRPSAAVFTRRPMVAAIAGLLGIALATAVRWAMVHGHAAPGLDGVVFAACLVGVCGLVGVINSSEPLEVGVVRPSGQAWPAVGAVCLGLFGGLVLVAIPLFVRLPGAAALQPAPWPGASFSTWATVTILVAATEEACFRGVLLESMTRQHGVLMAVAWTSLAFALVHVPFYGWGALPIDLAAGVWLAGLKLTSGRLTTPVITHALADLVTWWL